MKTEEEEEAEPEPCLRPLGLQLVGFLAVLLQVRQHGLQQTRDVKKTLENLRKPQGTSEKQPLSQSVNDQVHTCLEAARVQKTSSQPLHRHLVGVWTLVPPWSATRWCCRCSCWPNTREQPCHCRGSARVRKRMNV